MMGILSRAATLMVDVRQNGGSPDHYQAAVASLDHLQPVQRQQRD
jgi:hypothetical protein